MTNQRERVLTYMQEHKVITSLDAYREFGIMRLASRISELKKMGYPIEKTMVAIKNRYGETSEKAVGKYCLYNNI